MIDVIIQAIENAPPGTPFAAVIAVLLICGIGVPFPEEIPLLAAGYLAYLGEVSLATCFFWTIIAILIGDSILFSIGHRFGHRIFQIPLLNKLLTPQRVRKANIRFHRYGNRVVFVGRFMAGVRGTVFLTAGVLKMPYRRFIFFDGLAALVSAPVIVYLAYRFGSHLEEAAQLARETSWTLLVMVAVLAVGMSFLWVRVRKRRRVERRLRASQRA